MPDEPPRKADLVAAYALEVKALRQKVATLQADRCEAEEKLAETFLKLGDRERQIVVLRVSRNVWRERALALAQKLEHIWEGVEHG